MADARQRLARRHELVVDAQLFLDLLDDGDLVGRVVDHEIARQSDFRRFAPQQPRAQRVEGGQPHAARVLADQRFDALAHFAGRFVGERHRQHLVRLRVAVADEVCDPIRDDASLPRARTGEDEQRSLAVQHGVALFGIEFGEEIHGEGPVIIASVRTSRIGRPEDRKVGGSEGRRIGRPEDRKAGGSEGRRL
jgi:hypothetical protein